MTKVPRDLSGRDLGQALKQLGYHQVRRESSHMRLESSEQGLHAVTIVDTARLNIGTLNNILKSVEAHLGMTHDELLRRLFG